MAWMWWYKGNNFKKSGAYSFEQLGGYSYNYSWFYIKRQLEAKYLLSSVSTELVEFFLHKNQDCWSFIYCCYSILKQEPKGIKRRICSSSVNLLIGDNYLSYTAVKFLGMINPKLNAITVSDSKMWFWLVYYMADDYSYSQILKWLKLVLSVRVTVHFSDLPSLAILCIFILFLYWHGPWCLK
jgi:hypothetical protein